MRKRNGDEVEARLRECSLYDPELDLAVMMEDGEDAGYALFWFDEVTRVGILEPMRVEDAYQRRGLGRSLLAAGLERLAARGSERFKIQFGGGSGRDLYLGAGFGDNAWSLSDPTGSVGTSPNLARAIDGIASPMGPPSRVRGPHSHTGARPGSCGGSICPRSRGSPHRRRGWLGFEHPPVGRTLAMRWQDLREGVRSLGTRYATATSSRCTSTKSMAVSRRIDFIVLT
jgi:GNAT superfamily N-acetyltransferase